MIRLDLDIEGLELLSQALLNMPDRVADVAEAAGREAVRVLDPSIAQETPVKTGFLVDSEELFQVGADVWFKAEAQYARFVASGTRHMRANPFVERGVENVESQVETIYEAAFTELAENFRAI